MTLPVIDLKQAESLFDIRPLQPSLGAEISGIDLAQPLDDHRLGALRAALLHYRVLFFRDQDIAVVGGGDSAVEEATFLTKFARSVTLIHRRDELRASKIMAERAHANDKIRFAWNSAVEAIHGGDKLSGVTLRDTATGETSELAVTGLFIAIGHDPRNELVQGRVDLDDEGYVVCEGRSTRTSVPGVFACGDLVDHTYRQAITAAVGLPAITSLAKDGPDNAA